MKLYAHPFSGNSRRVRLVIAHLGLAVEEVLVDLARGEQRAPEYLAKNPNGRVPTLVDGDLALWESRAIMMHLADETPGQTLLPRGGPARADVTRWLFWCAQDLSPATAILNRELFVKGLTGGGPPDAAEVARGRALVGKALAVLEGHLAGALVTNAAPSPASPTDALVTNSAPSPASPTDASRTWLSGPGVTLADLSLAAAFPLPGPAEIPLNDYPAVAAWRARVMGLPAWEATAPRRP